MSTSNETDLKRLYPPSLSLQKVLVFMRHGERTPISFTRFPKSSVFDNIWRFCAHRSQSVIVNSPDGSAAGFRNVAVPATSPPPPPPLSSDSPDSPPVSFDGELLVNPEFEVNRCHEAELTDVGAESSRSLGFQLRQLYVHRLHFLPSHMGGKNPSQLISVTSTVVPRALQTAQHVAIGLLGDTSEEAQRLPTFIIQTRSPKQEILYPNYSRCDPLRHLISRLRKEVKKDLQWTERREALRTRLPHIFDSVSPHGLFDDVQARLAHSIPMEPGVDDKVQREIERLSIEEWFFPYVYSEAALRLSAGPMLDEIRKQLTTKTTSSTTRMNIYSGHDTTIGPLLIGLGAYDNEHWPRFNANVVIEQFKDKESTTNEEWIRVKYNGRAVALPACEGYIYKNDASLCAKKQFLQLLSMTATDSVAFERECQAIADEKLKKK